MASKWTKIGKCGFCLPTGGAIMDATWKDDGSMAWKCRNCGTMTDRRENKRTADKPTPRQQRTLDALANNSRLRNPAVTRQEMIGRKVFFVVEEKDVHPLTQITICGTIGPRGKLDATYRVVGYSRKITDAYFLI